MLPPAPQPPRAASVYVEFDSTSGSPLMASEQGHSYCASGRIFTGRLQLRSAEGTALLTLRVQTGGWMSAESPFARAGHCPADPAWGAYTPLSYPDTAFPALPGPTLVSTLRTGRLRGFRIPDPPGTGRSSLMIHASARRGSEGCISTPENADWESFCAEMEALQRAGIRQLPLRVDYTCPPPDPLRHP